MLKEKYNKLIAILEQMGGVAVAASGGLDSMFLSMTASKVLGDKMMAITVSTPYMHSSELEDVKRTFEQAAINFEVLELGIPEIIRKNPENRCYLCKTTLFKQILELADTKGFNILADGTNSGDLLEHRPGLKALEELKVRSPLKEAGLDKDDIRKLAKEFGYPFHDKDSNSCLLTRMPYNYEIMESEILQVEKAEAFLEAEGFRQIRVRTKNNRGLIEVRPDQIPKLKKSITSPTYSIFFKSIGYREIKVDDIGYKAGRNK